MHYNCLIVDDEVELAQMTAEYFKMFEITTEYVDSAKACYSFFEDGNTADLILLDINLGDGSGFDVCKHLREDMQLPILFISARQSDDDVLIALSIGGDDYVKKPYSLSILLAKVKVTLKRIAQTNTADTQARETDTDKCAALSSDLADSNETERLVLDGATMSAILDGKKVSLKAKEYTLLDCLYRHRNSIVKKEVLFDEVWGDTFFSDSTLNVHIRKLREKLEENPNDPKIIKTVWGTGYYLEI